MSNTSNFAITPLTEIAVQMDSNLDNVLQLHNSTIANALGISNIDITSVIPNDVNVEKINKDNSGKYSTILAMLSQLEDNKSIKGDTLSAIMASFKTDLKNNRILDSNTKSLLKTSLQNLTTNQNIDKNVDLDIVYDLRNNLDFSNKSFNINNVGKNFTKLDINGNPLAIQNQAWRIDGSESNGTQWSCVKDNESELIWEVKTDSGNVDTDTSDSNNLNIHHRDNQYQWGGKTANGKNDTFALTNYDYFNDWNSLVDGSNNENNDNGLCGLTNWRVPSVNELFLLLQMGSNDYTYKMNKDYFPNILIGRSTYYDGNSVNVDTTPVSFWASNPSPNRIKIYLSYANAVNGDGKSGGNTYIPEDSARKKGVMLVSSGKQ
jgi:hypothetical protein